MVPIFTEQDEKDIIEGIRKVAKWRKCSFYKRERGLVNRPRAGRPFFFPLEEISQIKALACQLPARKEGDLDVYPSESSI